MPETLSFEDAAPVATLSFEDAKPQPLSFEDARPQDDNKPDPLTQPVGIAPLNVWGSEGEAPAGPPPVETDMQRAVRQGIPEIDVGKTVAAIPGQAGKILFQAANQPIIEAHPPQEEVERVAREGTPLEKRAMGIRQGIDEFLSGLTSPLGIGTFGLSKFPAASKAIGAIFAYTMGKEFADPIAKELGEEFGKPKEQRDDQKIATLLTRAGFGSLMAAGIGADIVNPLIPKTSQVLRERAVAKEAQKVLEQGESTPPNNEPKPIVETGERTTEGITPLTAEALKEAIESNRLKPARDAGAAGEPEIIGMGGAVTSEFVNNPNTATSIKNATVDSERQKRGLPPAMQPARRSFGRVWDEAMALIDRDPGFQDRLLADLRAKPRALTDLEDALLLHRQIDLQNEYGKATRDLAQAYEDGRMDDVGREKARVASLSDQLLDVYDIGKKVGTETGRGLNARKMMAFEDYSLAKMELEKRAVKGGKPLTDAERAEVVELNKRIEETQKRYDDYVAKTDERIAALEVDRALLEAKANAKKEPVVEPHIRIIADKVKTYFDNRAEAALKRLQGKTFTLSPEVLADLTDLGVSKILSGSIEFAEWSAKMAATLGERIKPHLQTVWESSQNALDNHVKKVGGGKSDKVKRAVKGMDISEKTKQVKESIKERLDSGEKDSVTPSLQKLARLFIEQGITERDGLIDAVHKVLVEIDPTITRREAMDAISGYGDFRQLTKDEISVQLRDLKGQMQNVAKLEDIQSRKPPLKTGVERRSPSDEERRLIKLVNEAKRKYGIVVTDPATQLASALQARKTYYKNRIADLESEIAARERVVKSKSPSPTDAELESLKKEYNEVKAEHDSIFENELDAEQRLRLAISAAERSEAKWKERLDAAKKGDFSTPESKPKLTSPELDVIRARREAIKEEIENLKDLDAGIQKAKAAEKLASQKAALEKEIAERERKLSEGDLSTEGRRANRPLSPELEPLRQQLDSLNRKLAEARKKPAAQKYAEQLQRQVESLNKRIAEKEEQIASGDISPSGAAKVNRPLPPELEKAKQRLEELNDQIRELRHPTKTDLERLKSRLKSQAEKYQDKLARADFSKPAKKVVTMDAEANRLHYEMTQAKIKWHEALMRDRLANRSTFQKVLGTAGEVLNTSRAVITSLDLSAVLRQGGFIVFGHPIRAIKAFPAMFRSLLSESKQHAVNQEIAQRKNFPLYNQSKLYLSEHGQKLSQMEEAYMSRWADKIPLVAASQRAYVTFLNKLRADSFDAMAATLARDKELTPSEANAIANYINVATGRGNLGVKENALVGLNSTFFAPRYVASRFQLLLGQPLYRGTARTRILIAKEYGKFLIGIGVVYGLAQLDDESSVETDPRSSDFGKIRFGNTRVDPLAGLSQSTVLLSRLASGETKKLNGKIVPIRGDKVPYGSGDSVGVMSRFLRTKLAPVPGMAVDLLNGKDVVEKKVTLESELVQASLPLSFKDIYATMREQGVPKGTALSLLSIFGMGLQNYDE